MIDTIGLFTDDFEVSDDCNIRIQKGTIDNATGESYNVPLFRDSKGEWVTGYKAYLNDSDRAINLDIETNTRKTGGHLKLRFSPPKVLNGSNYYPLNDSDLLESFKVLQRNLDDSGIRLNLGACGVGRLDACRNAYTDYPFGVYLPILNGISISRRDKRVYDSDTVLWKNKQRQLCVYDKNKEAKLDGLVLSDYPENAVRFEYRLLKSESVTKATGIETLRDIKDTFTVREAYRKELTKNVFKGDVDRNASEVLASDDDIADWYQNESGKRFWYREYTLDKRAYENLIGMPESARRAWWERRYPDDKQARSRAFLDETRRGLEYQKLVESGVRKPYGVLFKELESKILGKD